MRFFFSLVSYLLFSVAAFAVGPETKAPLPQISTPMPNMRAMPGQKAANTIDMTTVLKDDAGKPIVDQYVREPDDPACSKCGPLTLGHAIAHALFTSFPDEKDLSGEQKWARGALAEKIENNAHAQLDSNQIVLIEKLLGKMYNGVVITKAYPLLDPNKEPPPLVP